jgi:hypothetical protein
MMARMAGFPKIGAEVKSKGSFASKQQEQDISGQSAALPILI